MTYKDEKPIAYKCTSNWGGIEILSLNERDEKVIVRDNYGTPSKAHSSKIRYDKNGNPYFKHNGFKEYFDEYLRINK